MAASDMHIVCDSPTVIYNHVKLLNANFLTFCVTFLHMDSTPASNSILREEAVPKWVAKHLFELYYSGRVLLSLYVPILNMT